MEKVDSLILINTCFIGMIESRVVRIRLEQSIMSQLSRMNTSRKTECVFACALLCGFSVSSCADYLETEPAVDNPRVQRIVSIDSEAVNNDAILNINTINSVLTSVFEVVTGRVYDNRYLELSQFPEQLVPDSTEYILQLDEDYYVINEYPCTQGGRAILSYRNENVGEFQDRTMSFSDCRLENIIYDGAASQFSTDFGDTYYVFNEMEISEVSNSRSELSGFLSQKLFVGSKRLQILNVDEGMLSVQNEEGDVMLTNVTTRFAYGTFCPRFVTCYDAAFMDASFTMQVSALGNSTLTVDTVSTFQSTSDSSRRFNTGVLHITASDGSQLTLEADNGDPATFTITLENTDGEMKYDELWDLWLTQLTFS